MKNVLVVSSDAGGTYALVPVVRELKNRGVKVMIVASGPAIQIWKAEDSRLFESLEDSIEEDKATNQIKHFNPELVISGAGAYNMIEHTFRRASADLGIFSFSLVDGWFNFKARFQREQNGTVNNSIPDLIGVMNEASRAEMIEEGFNADKIVIVGAPHIEETVRFIKTISVADIRALSARYRLIEGVITFVYFSAPVVNDPHKIAMGEPDLGYTEKTIMFEIIDALNKACRRHNNNAQLLIKPHPGESCEMVKLYFSEALQKAGDSPLLSCRIINDCTTKELISISDVVLGMTTTALVEASYAGKNSLSVQIGRNLACHPDKYFSKIPGVVAIYKAEELLDTLGGVLLSAQQGGMGNVCAENAISAASRTVDILFSRGISNEAQDRLSSKFTETV